MPNFGLVITTFRGMKRENILKLVYMDVKRGNHFNAAKKVNLYVRYKIDWSEVTDYKGYPAVGVYEGGREPSAHIYFTVPKRASIKLRTELKRFKDRANQDSILLYEFVKSGGAPVLEISIKPGQSLNRIRQVISKPTNDKLGGYLTYIYSLRKIIIVNVKEFDSLTPSEFRELIPGVKQAVELYGGNVTVKQAKVTVI